MIAWRTIPGWDAYEVSNTGIVRRRQTGNEICRCLRDGYPRVQLWKDGKPKSRCVHLLILIAFVGPRPRGRIARHLDGRRINCHLSNLTWGTRLENAADALKHGTRARGEKIGKGLLTKSCVRRIRSLHKSGKSINVIAARFGTDPSNISRITRGLRWGWLA